MSEDGNTIYLVIANGSWDRSVPCSLGFRNFKADGATGTVLSHSDPDGKPLLERKEEAISDVDVTVSEQQVACVIPAHSIVFLTVDRR